MAYKHILIAVDLSPESKILVEKAVSMARPYNAKVSLIHVDVNYSDLYTGLIDVNLGDMQKRISEETHQALTELSQNAGYPITETLSGSGDLAQVLVDAIKKYDMDLVLCGHHQDFWARSAARPLPAEYPDQTRPSRRPPRSRRANGHPLCGSPRSRPDR